MRNVELARIGADVVLEIAVRVGSQLRLADQRHGHFIDQPQEFEIFHGLVGQFSVQRRRRCHADVPQQQCVPVRLGLGHFVGPNGAASPRSVLYREVTAWHGLAHGFSQVTCHAVSRATGCKRHHKGDRLAAWVVLGKGVAHAHNGQRCGHQRCFEFHAVSMYVYKKTPCYGHRETHDIRGTTY